jgi:protein-L-isoaspartate(D-aspartate) O-methyltransferase
MDGESVDPGTLHQKLVDHLLEQKLITSPAVEAAFRAVRREHFLPDLSPEEVYRDRAIITKKDESGRPISSSSQPAMMAIMLEQLDLQPGHNVLEIGAGTGYNAALMAHMVGEQGRVTTIDIDDDLAQSARSYLAAAGYDRVYVVCGDGMRGYAQNAPYDRIILAVAGWDIPREWLEQLQPDGRIVLPLSFYGPQLSIAFERQDGCLISRSVRGCGFMPVRGPRSEPLHKIRLAGHWDLTLTRHSEAQARRIDAATLEEWLREPFAQQPTELQLSGREILFQWALWAAFHEPNYVLLTSNEEPDDEDLVPDLFPPFGVNTGVLTASGLALLVLAPDTVLPETGDRFEQTFTLHVRGYGPDKTVAERLLRHLHTWDAAGRPWNEGTSVVALPVNEAPDWSSADMWLTRRWHHLGIRWK